MDWRYIAGFFDGEGSIIRRANHRFYIQISNTHKPVLDEIAKFVGCGTVREVIPNKNKPHWKRAYVYMIQRMEDAKNFLLSINTFLIVKKEAALFALAKLKVGRQQIKYRQQQLKERNYKINEEWESEKYESKAALGRAFNLSRERIRIIVGNNPAKV